MNIKNDFSNHISQKYNADLVNIHAQVCAMGGAVEKQLSDALRSMLTGDSELAQKVIEHDHAINQQELAIDRLCTSVIALRSPVASDLRLIFAVIKSVSDLERIGDLASNIANLNKNLIKKCISTRYYPELNTLGQHTQEMLKNVLDAFARFDAPMAIKTIATSANIHAESSQLSRLLISYMKEEPKVIKHILRMLNIIRHLERIASRCENVCEYVVYLVKGEDIRYSGLDSMRHHILDDNEGNEK